MILHALAAIERTLPMTDPTMDTTRLFARKAATVLVTNALVAMQTEVANSCSEMMQEPPCINPSNQFAAFGNDESRCDGDIKTALPTESISFNLICLICYCKYGMTVSNYRVARQ